MEETFDINDIMTEIDLNKEIQDTFKIIKVINQRANRCSAIAIHNNTKTKYFIKIKTVNTVSDNELNIHNILKNNKHNNLINIINYFRSDNLYVFVYEYFFSDDLKSYYMNTNKPNISSVCSQICDAVNFMHSLNIVHCDIKPENILMNKKGHIKLTDFESAMLCQNIVSLNSSIGTFGFMAPECFDICVYSQKSDLWSLGVTLYYLQTGKLPFTDEISCDTSFTIKNNFKHINKKRIVNSPIKTLITNLLNFLPKNRVIN